MDAQDANPFKTSTSETALGYGWSKWLATFHRRNLTAGLNLDRCHRTIKSPNCFRLNGRYRCERNLDKRAPRRKLGRAHQCETELVGVERLDLGDAGVFGSPVEVRSPVRSIEYLLLEVREQVDAAKGPLDQLGQFRR